MSSSPGQAVKTNVMGSHNVLQAAAKAGVMSVVCLSTDKAVYPVNAMGMSKALMEKTAQAFAATTRTRRRPSPSPGTATSCTRAVRSSLFVNQIQNGEPLSLTEPSMTCFLMSLQESVDLVEHAFVHAQPGTCSCERRSRPPSTCSPAGACVVSPRRSPAHATIVQGGVLSSGCDTGGGFDSARGVVVNVATGVAGLSDVEVGRGCRRARRA